MDNPETSLIIASTRQLPTFEPNKWFVEDKSKALEKAALIGKVTGHDSKVIAVRAQQELKGLIAAIEKTRKQLKEPILDAGRRLDNLCASETLELEKEFGRISNAVREFDDAERRRVLEEQRRQQEELERIEREKQAELKRIADEQARVEREAREAREAAERAAAEATSKKEREAAAKAKAEADRLASEAAAKAAQAQAVAAAVEEKASESAYIAGKPIEITKVSGQRTVSDYEITKINEWALLKGRPDLVRKIEFDMRAIKDELKRGVKLPGVEAKEVYKADVRAASLTTIEV